ncbi:MAG: YidC/Oxa1 family membrane protein insertase, partial [Oscillospiraceae bacterium]
RMGFLGTPLGFIMYWLFQFIQNYGLTLIIFVIITKLALLPLAIKQQKSTAKTMAFQPKLKKLEKQYGTNKQKYQEEMMKLYEKEGVSPMGGCLPTLIQMLLLFGIVDVIYNPLKHLLHIDAAIITKAGAAIGKAASQLNIIKTVQADPQKYASIFGDQLSKVTDFKMTFLGLNLGDIPNQVWGILILIPVISFITQVLSTLISMRQQKAMGQTMQGPMKGMMYIMPIFSLFIAFTLPAGVGVYWIVSNIFQLGQQVLLYKVYSPEKLATMQDKGSEKVRKKMAKKRLKMEAYNKLMEERGIAPKGQATPDIEKIKELNGESISEKEAAKKRLAEARRRQAEKYGEDYKE